MATDSQSAPVSKKALWAGRIMSALPVLLLLFSGALKLLRPKEVVEGFEQMGYPQGLAVWLGIVEIACAILYVVPRTSVLGAILVTGYLGGAVATHVRAGGSLFQILFPVIMGALVWGGLCLRDERLPGHLKSDAQSAAVSKKAFWVGIIASAPPVLTLLFAGVMVLAKPASMAPEFGRLGYPDSVILGIGILEITCTVIYIIPRVSALGAILLTGYLGGAVATHARIGDPSYNIIMPILFGALAWGGLYLRDARLRDLLPLRKEK
ncbi:MAG TPA: DoxX family protein [Blastocatellia bacterium]